MTDFANAFKTLTGHPPLLWQTRLYDELIHGRLPSALDLPTGLGKTSVIAIWLAARAGGADLPRRLVYVVDRRAVVDQATEIAELIAKELGDGTGRTDAIRGLRSGLGLTTGMTLPVSTLRGQYVDNREWLESPAMPAVVVGTIDMIGSRLLFQGYGVSPKMRPVHAALLGADTLVVLDEAHLVPPFEHLLRAVATWPRAQGIPAFRVLTLSATGRTDGDAPFRLTAEDLEDPRTSARLRAPKRLKVADSTADLAEMLAQRALELGESSLRVIAFCNSRKVAKKVAERLGTLARAEFGKATPLPALLVGGRRVWERAKLGDDPVFARFRPQTAAAATAHTTPAYLVATSAGEVGVDLDADHLVMDLVPWERMVQRLGRVNRRAEPGESLVDVFVAVPDKDAESGKDVGADEVQVWRAPFEFAAWPRDADGRRDASPLSLLCLRENTEFAKLTKAASTREPLHPDLSGPLLDAWAMTSLDEHPGRPEVAPWLRGWIDDEAQTRLVWRRLFPIRPGDLESGRATALEKNLKAFFESAAPHLSETLDVPTYQVVELLRKRIVPWCEARVASSNSEAEIEQTTSPLVVILGTRDEVEAALCAKQIDEMDPKALTRRLTGRTVVIDARLGGLGSDGLLDDKRDAQPLTIDASPAEVDARAEVDKWTRTAGLRVRKVNRADDSASDEIDWPIEYRFDLAIESEEEGQELRVEVLRVKGATRGDAAIARMEQGLGEHHAWTAEAARRIAQALKLPADHENVLVAAAAVHDAGKARELWQNAMRAPKDRRPYAKTRGGGDFRALMLDGATYRHEFGSVGDAERDSAVAALPDGLRDLALHLVAAHHGYARPVIAPVDPEMPPSLTVERARAIALRFYRVHRTWGPWGLAWWESLLRAADWAASRAANERNGQQ